MTSSPTPRATRLLIGTNNAGKLHEFRALLAPLHFTLLSPAEAGLALEVEETGDTLEANAILKARAFAESSGLPALADDSGLEVDALGGLPGVRSARWVAGTDADRVAALLARMSDVPTAGRVARFRAVVALALPGVAHVATASGSVLGRIAEAPRGSHGFGYDPVFLVTDGGYHGEVTMAELRAGSKGDLSHRGRATRALMPALLGLLLL